METGRKMIIWLMGLKLPLKIALQPQAKTHNYPPPRPKTWNCPLEQTWRCPTSQSPKPKIVRQAQTQKPKLPVKLKPKRQNCPQTKPWNCHQKPKPDIASWAKIWNCPSSQDLKVAPKPKLEIEAISERQFQSFSFFLPSKTLFFRQNPRCFHSSRETFLQPTFLTILPGL